MPARLRPKTPLAADAILVGDPARSLLLAQELLTEPKMSNHARGLWGYSGRTADGRELTIQATGMGGPSAALVLADLAKLGVRRAVRVGTCAGFGGEAELGALLLVSEAVAVGGSAASFGVAPGECALPDATLQESLREALGAVVPAIPVASLDTVPAAATENEVGAAAADMQSLAVLARARELGVAAAALLIVAERAGGERLEDEKLEKAAAGAGRAAAQALSNPQVEG